MIMTVSLLFDPRCWGVLAGLYVAVSSILFQFPHLLHRRRPYRPVFDVRTIAHRGGREHTPENTIAAFRNGARHSDMLELDVWLTTDGDVVVFHDDDLHRMTNGDDLRRTDELSSKEWSDLLLRPKPSDGWDQGHAKDDGKQQYAVPFLKDIFAALPRETRFIIEFKQDSQALVEKVYAMAAEDGRLDHIVWFSLKQPINQRLCDFSRSVPRIVSVQAVLRITLLFFCGLLPFVDVPEDIFGLKVRRSSGRALIRDPFIFSSLLLHFHRSAR